MLRVQLARLVRRALGGRAAAVPTVASFPHPYRAAIAVSNDCEFMSWDDYLGIYRFLNDRSGLALEVGTSLFFHVTHALCHSSFSYFDFRSETPTAHAPLIREMVAAGYIDTIHAYGDFDDGSFTRAHAEVVAAECERHELRFPFWTNHGSDRNFQNLGHERLAVYQHGDDPAQPQYHLDLLRRTGAEFFWVDDGYQQAVGDGTPLLYEETARDGTRLQLVRRYRGLHGKPPPMAKSLAEQVTADDVDHLIERGEACIYYQHLGAWNRPEPGTFVANHPPYFEEAGVAVLEHLARRFAGGDCLVTTPSRLLRYLRMRDTVEVVTAGEEIVVDPHGIRSAELEGLTIRCSRRPQAVVVDEDGGRRRLDVQEHGDGETVVLTVPWRRLPEFAW